MTDLHIYRITELDLGLINLFASLQRNRTRVAGVLVCSSGVSTEVEQEGTSACFKRDDAICSYLLIFAALQDSRLPAEERYQIIRRLKTEKENYPSDLKALGALVKAQARRVVHKLRWKVDTIVKTVASKGLDQGYQEYAERYKRKWAGDRDHKVCLLVIAACIGSEVSA
jgi:hypothetical protein